MMQHRIFGSSEETDDIDGHTARPFIETLVFRINQRLEKRRIDLIIFDRRTVLIEIFANKLTVCTINLRGLVRWWVKNAREITRALTKQPKEVDIYSSKINENESYKRQKRHKRLCIPRLTDVQALVPRPEGLHLAPCPTHDLSDFLHKALLSIPNRNLIHLLSCKDTYSSLNSLPIETILYFVKAKKEEVPHGTPPKVMGQETSSPV